jgi:hypothetical protein
VETLIAYRGDPAGDKLFAAAGASIFDVTTAGSLPSATYASAASARWNYTNFANDAGRFAILVNGAQDPDQVRRLGLLGQRDHRGFGLDHPGPPT